MCLYIFNFTFKILMPWNKEWCLIALNKKENLILKFNVFLFLNLFLLIKIFWSFFIKISKCKVRFGPYIIWDICLFLKKNVEFLSVRGFWSFLRFYKNLRSFKIFILLFLTLIVTLKENKWKKNQRIVFN